MFRSPYKTIRLLRITIQYFNTRLPFFQAFPGYISKHLANIHNFNTRFSTPCAPLRRRRRFFRIFRLPVPPSPSPFRSLSRNLSLPGRPTVGRGGTSVLRFPHPSAPLPLSRLSCAVPTLFIPRPAMFPPFPPDFSSFSSFSSPSAPFFFFPFPFSVLSFPPPSSSLSSLFLSPSLFLVCFSFPRSSSSPPPPLPPSGFSAPSSPTQSGTA